MQNFVRPCFGQDLETVRLIAAHHALTGFSWLESQPPSEADLVAAWSRTVDAGLPYIVACPRSDPSRVLGFGYAQEGLFGSPLLCGRPELRLAVHPSHLRKGLGALLLSALLEDLASAGAAGASCSFGHEEASAPLALVTRAKFTKAVRLSAAARKFGKVYDVVVATRAL